MAITVACASKITIPSPFGASDAPFTMRRIVISARTKLAHGVRHIVRTLKLPGNTIVTLGGIGGE